MSDFKLIAIRPLKGCSKKYLKVLKENKPYVFYSEYDFTEYSDINRVITKNESFNVYSNAGSNIEFNVSAIVGKNGSGKSSLIELLYVALYNISCIKEVIYREEKRRNLNSSDIEKDIKVELFYKIENDVYLLHLDNKEIKGFKLFNNKFNAVDLFDDNWNKFFYSIAINYSHYALNSNEIGPWINSVFHKNDAYQTPIVINPMRTEGNIEINNENYLVKSRLLANILSEEHDLKELADGKLVQNLRFSLDQKKIDKIKKIKLDRYEKILPELFNVFLENFEIDKNTIYYGESILYIQHKLRSIIQKYSQYKKFYDLISPKIETEKLNANILRLVNCLYKDDSHITFKLRQALYFLKYQSCINKKKIGSIEKIDNLSKKIKTIQEKENLNLIEIIPPSFFYIEIFFDNEENSFAKLSSGEKQQIYSTSSIIYHLTNLDSVQEHTDSRDPDEKPKIKYNYVNFIFDEVELYYHPELQRKLINNLYQRISKIKFKDLKAINCVFVTHSPFILSDIPHTNILFLEGGNTIPAQKIPKTFGANIHDLLKEGFFLENGLIGEFTKEKIIHLLKFLSSDTQKSTKFNLDRGKSKNIIDTIGEPIVKKRLSDLWRLKFHGKTYEDLQKENERLKKELTKKNNLR